jgi:hypothetical protein
MVGFFSFSHLFDVESGLLGLLAFMFAHTCFGARLMYKPKSKPHSLAEVNFFHKKNDFYFIIYHPSMFKY